SPTSAAPASAAPTGVAPSAAISLQSDVAPAPTPIAPTLSVAAFDDSPEPDLPLQALSELPPMAPASMTAASASPTYIEPAPVAPPRAAPSAPVSTYRPA